MSGDSQGHTVRSLATRRNFVRAAGVSGVVGLAGCMGGGESNTTTDGGGNNQNGGTTTTTSGGSGISGKEVHFLTQEGTPKFKQYWEDLASAFEDETGASVRLEYTGETGTGPKQRILQLTQAGNPPEVAQTTIPTAAELGARGLLVDHSDVIATFEDKYGPFPEQFLLEFDGNQTFVPMVQNTHSKWYRSDIFGKVPNTWEKELEMARKHDEGPGEMRGEWLSNSSKILAPMINLFSRGWGNDAVVCQRDGDGNVQVVMDQEPYRSRWIEVFEHVQKLQQYSPKNVGAGWTDLMSAIENGRTAQIIMYGSRGKDENNNDFVKNIRNTTWPVPSSKYEEGGRRSWGNTAGFLTFKGSNEKAGQEFLKFWSKREHYFELFLPHPAHLVPMQEGIYNDSEFKGMLQDALGPQWDYERDVKNLFQMSKSSFDVPLETTPANPYAGPLVGSNELGAAQIDIIVNGMGVEESIDKHAKNMQTIIDETHL